jgi:hypothetical protein
MTYLEGVLVGVETAPLDGVVAPCDSSGGAAIEADDSSLRYAWCVGVKRDVMKDS